MSGLLPRSENHATKIVPSCASTTLGSSSLVGLPTESRIGWPGANASGSAGACESLHEPPTTTSAAAERRRNLTVRARTRGRALVGALRGHRTDHSRHFHDAVGGEAALAGVLFHGVRVGRVVDAVDLVTGDIAVDPLHVFSGRVHVVDHTARLFGDRLKLITRELSGARNLALDKELRHRYSNP